LTLAPTVPTSTDNVRVTVSGCTDPDGDNLCYAYRWFVWDARRSTWAERQATNTRSANNVLSAALTAKGEIWKCSVRAGDGMEVSGWTEVKFRIDNTSPPAPRLSITPSAPRSTDGVVASVQPVADADGDVVRYGFRWLLGGKTRRSAAGSRPSDTLPADYTGRGQVWVCQAWTGDGNALSETVAVEVTIGNSPPPAPSVAITPVQPGVGVAIKVMARPVVDPDRDAVVYGYRWMLNGVTKRVKVTTATSDTLPAGMTRRGQVWTLVVRAGDGRSSGEPTEVQFRIGAASPASLASVATITCVSSLSAVPTAAGAQIVFTLSAPASVQAEVLNIAGRPVKLITPGTQFEAGTQTMIWTGQTDAGLQTPSGRYLIRLTARGEDGTSTQALGTVLIQR